eukprot:scaffold4860_cov32-Tisochrysis_lutea.AAC.1
MRNRGWASLHSPHPDQPSPVPRSPFPFPVPRSLHRPRHRPLSTCSCSLFFRPMHLRKQVEAGPFLARSPLSSHLIRDTLPILATGCSLNALKSCPYSP